MAAAEQNQAYLEAAIASSLAKISQNDAGIQDSQAKIDELERTIRQLRDQADALRSKKSTLEVQVERLRNDITVAQNKEQRLNQKIKELEDRIVTENKKIVQDDLDKLNNQINILKNSLPGAEAEVDRQYFNCYGEGAVTVEKTGSTTVYIVRGEDFQNLLENTYGLDFSDFACCDGQKVDPQAGSGSGSGSSLQKEPVKPEYRFESVDIYSKPYVDQVGYPFPEEVKAPYVEDKATKFDSDFSCVANTDTALRGAGRGVITSLEGNTYNIRTYAKSGKPTDEKIQIGSCTVVMSTVKVPRPGMNIAYTGNTGANLQADMITVW